MAGDDFLYVNILGDTNLLRNLDHMPDTVRAIVLDKVEKWTAKVKQDVADNIESRLQEKTGKLREGLDSEVTEKEGRIQGRVFIAGVPYAAAQERGATTGPHMIFPDKARVLAFYGREGKKVFATKVMHPGGRIPAHNFMKDAYRENAPDIARDIKKGIIEGIRANMRGGA